MSTVLQKKVARRIPKVIQSNQPITGGQLVASVGYGKDMQRKPGEVLNSKGVQDELAIIGFTEDKAKEVVAVILGDSAEKAEARLKAADMVFKSFGTYAAEKHINVNIKAEPSDRIKELADKLRKADT